MTNNEVNILWFHDESDFKWTINIESIIQKYFLPGSIIIYKDLFKLYDDINALKASRQVILIASGPLCRQMVSLVVDNVHIKCIFIIEYEPVMPLDTIKEERMRRTYFPSSNFIDKNLSVIPSMNSVNSGNILIIAWFSENSTADSSYLLTTSISIGSILMIFNEIPGSIYWFTILASVIEKIHNKYLIKSIQNSHITLYMNLFKEVLLLHPIEHELSLSGYRSLSRLHALRCEDSSLIHSYDYLLAGFLKKYNIHDIYCRVPLAAKFSKRPQNIYKSLALHLYHHTMKTVQLAEISGEKVDYRLNGCIFGSIAMIFFERKMYGMTNYYLNQALEQHRKHDPHCPLSDVYVTRASVQALLWKVTKSRKHLNESLNDLKQIEKTEHQINKNISDKDLLFTMFVVYNDLEQYSLALDCLDRVLLQLGNDECRMIDIYRGRGNVFIKLNQFDLALDNYNKALQFCSSSNKQQQQQAILNIALAVTYERKQEWDTSLEHLTQALIIYEQNNDDKCFLNDYPGSEIVHRHLSLIYEKVKNTDLADVHKKHAIIEKERLSRLHIRMNWPDDLYGYSISYTLRQVNLTDDCAIPHELLI